MEATVLLQSRGKTALMILGCLAFVGVGAVMLGDPDGTRRHSPEYVHAIAFLAIAFFGLCAIAGVGTLFRPPRLTIAPAGLTYEWWWRRQTWAWRDVGSFEVEGPWNRRMIRFDAASEARLGNPFAARPLIPGTWRKGINEVCRELNAARERWR